LNAAPRLVRARRRSIAELNFSDAIPGATAMIARIADHPRGTARRRA
jgi:hypothetical protein